MTTKQILALAASTLLATLANAEVLYTVEENTDILHTIDTSTGLLTPIGPLGVTFSFGDLAYDASTGTMYMSNGWGAGLSTPSSLYTVNLQTGAATLIGSTGALSIFGLAIDPTTGKLYGSASTTATGFYEINKSTGVATLLGDPAISLDGLTHIGGTNAVVGLFAGPGSLHQLNLTNGTPTLLSGGGGFVNNCGIAWGPASNQIFSIDWSGELYAFDIANSYARTTLVSSLGAFDGLAYAGAGGGCPPPTVYCTAGTTSNGCVPSIASSGTPSLAASNGFTVSASSVEGQRSGIFFYGVSGIQILPWATGSTSYLCVRPPTQRTSTQSSGGTNGACDGTLALDWRAFMSANPGALGQPLAAGQVFEGQFWFRDPPAAKTTNLTNALEWTLCP